MKTEQLKNEHCQECDFKGYKLDDTVGISFYAKMIPSKFFWMKVFFTIITLVFTKLIFPPSSFF